MVLNVHRNRKAYLGWGGGGGGRKSKGLDHALRLRKTKEVVDHCQNNCVKAVGTLPLCSNYLTAVSTAVQSGVTRTMSVAQVLRNSWSKRSPTFWAEFYFRTALEHQFTYFRAQLHLPALGLLWANMRVQHHLPTLDLFWANLRVQHHLPTLGLFWANLTWGSSTTSLLLICSGLTWGSSTTSLLLICSGLTWGSSTTSLLLICSGLTWGSSTTSLLLISPWPAKESLNLFVRVQLTSLLSFSCNLPQALLAEWPGFFT